MVSSFQSMKCDAITESWINYDVILHVAQISTSARALLANLAVGVLMTTKIMSAFVVKDSAGKSVNSVRWKQLSFTHLQLFNVIASILIVHQLLLIWPEEAKWTKGCFPCPLFPSPLHPLLKTTPCKLKTHKKLSCQIMKKKRSSSPVLELSHHD